ncbi:MAG: RrF2 family transcriptional regulator [Alphaproteobacteria bacterium]
MLKTPRKLLCAYEAVVDIAMRSGTSPVQSSDLTERQGIPRRYLEQVLQRLVRAKILVGVRGPRGGYRLAREQRRITLGEITRVLADIEENDGGVDFPVTSSMAQQVIVPLWERMQEVILSELDEITIADLCEQARSSGAVPGSQIAEHAV